MADMACRLIGIMADTGDIIIPTTPITAGTITMAMTGTAVVRTIEDGITLPPRLSRRQGDAAET